VISSKHRFTERYFYARAPQSIPFSQCFTVACTPGSGQDAAFQNHVAAVKLTSILTPTFVNEVLVDYSRNRGVLTSQSKITDESLGITPGDPTFPKMPTIAVVGQFSVGGNFNDDSDSTVNQYQYSDQVAWTHGRHTIRAGFAYERAQFDFNDPGPRRGILDFLSFPDFLLGMSAASIGSLLVKGGESAAHKPPKPAPASHVAPAPPRPTTTVPPKPATPPPRPTTTPPKPSTTPASTTPASTTPASTTTTTTTAHPPATTPAHAPTPKPKSGSSGSSSVNPKAVEAGVGVAGVGASVATTPKHKKPAASNTTDTAPAPAADTTTTPATEPATAPAASAEPDTTSAPATDDSGR